MKKSVLLSAILLSCSSIGLIMALVNDRWQEPTPPLTSASSSSSEVSTDVPDTSTLLFSTPLIEKDQFRVIKKKRTFEDFLSIFPTATLPYAFTEKRVLSILNEQSNNDWASVQNGSKESEKRRKAMIAAAKLESRNSDMIEQFVLQTNVIYFSRISHTYHPVAKMETADYYLILYALKHGFNSYPRHGVATFDKLGKRVANNWVGKIWNEEAETFIIDQALRATCYIQKVNWMHDYKSTPEAENRAVSLTFVKKKFINLARSRKEKPRNEISIDEPPVDSTKKAPPLPVVSTDEI